MPATPVPASSLGLRRVALLQGLPDTVLDAVAAACTWRRHAAGQAIVSRASGDQDVYFLIDGRVRATFHARSGREVSFRELGPGDMVGEIAAVDGGLRSLDVVALEPVVAARLGGADFARLRREHPDLAERHARHLTALVRKLTDAVIELSTLGVQNRIHAELLRLAREVRPAGDAASCLLRPAPTHVQIAARVSTTREQVTREISALCRAGVLQRVPRGLQVADLRRLEAMVQAAHAA